MEDRRGTPTLWAIGRFANGRFAIGRLCEAMGRRSAYRTLALRAMGRGKAAIGYRQGNGCTKVQPFFLVGSDYLDLSI